MRLSTPRLAAAALATSLFASQPATTQPALPGPANAPSLQGQLALSLGEAISMGIENNLDVEIVRHDPLIAGARATAAWGAYDVEAFGGYQFSDDETPIASSLQPSSTLDERSNQGNAGLRGLLPKLGWSYEVGYSAQGLETTSAISGLSPEYRAGLAGSVNLPILRGFLWGEPWVQVKLSGVQGEAAYESFRRQLMDAVRAIENAYWDLAARRDALRVARKSLETAKELLEQTDAQYEVGVVSKVEVIEAQAGLADREFRRIRVENQYRSAQDQLVDLVLGPFLEPGSELDVVPTDSPEDYKIFEVDPDEAAARAFANRPELQLVRKDVEQREIELKFARNQRLPQLDLQGSFGIDGLSGRTNSAPSVFGGPRAPVVVPRTFGSAHDDWFTGRQADSWSAGAMLSIPIGNIRGRANVSAASLELRRAQTQVRREEQRVVLEVREAVRNLASAIEGIEAAESRRLAATEQLRAERIRLEHGESTPFDVLLREEQLVDAESQKIGALQVYQGSVTELARAQGTILRDRNVVVDQALPLR